MFPRIIRTVLNLLPRLKKRPLADGISSQDSNPSRPPPCKKQRLSTVLEQPILEQLNPRQPPTTTHEHISKPPPTPSYLENWLDSTDPHHFIDPNVPILECDYPEPIMSSRDSFSSKTQESGSDEACWSETTTYSAMSSGTSSSITSVSSMDTHTPLFFRALFCLVADVTYLPDDNMSQDDVETPIWVKDLITRVIKHPSSRVTEPQPDWIEWDQSVLYTSWEEFEERRKRVGWKYTPPIYFVIPDVEVQAPFIWDEEIKPQAEAAEDTRFLDSTLCPFGNVVPIAPKPNIAIGYRYESFHLQTGAKIQDLKSRVRQSRATKNERAALPNIERIMDSMCINKTKLVAPYLLAEWIAPTDEIAKASNRCIVSTVTALRTCQDAFPQHHAVFSFQVSPEAATCWITWMSDDPSEKITMKQIYTFRLDDADRYVAFLRTMRNIHAWGMGDRHDAFNAFLDDVYEEELQGEQPSIAPSPPPIPQPVSQPLKSPSERPVASSTPPAVPSIHGPVTRARSRASKSNRNQS